MEENGWKVTKQSFVLQKCDIPLEFNGTLVKCVRKLVVNPTHITVTLYNKILLESGVSNTV